MIGSKDHLRWFAFATEKSTSSKAHFQENGILTPSPAIKLASTWEAIIKNTLQKFGFIKRVDKG